MHDRRFSSPACLALALVGAFLTGNASADERFVQKVTIHPGLVVVVSEGDLEARSIGSYSVRVYSDPGAVMVVVQSAGSGGSRSSRPSSSGL